MHRRLFLSLCLLFAAASSARAEVIISNFGGNGDGQGFGVFSTSWGALGIDVTQDYTLTSVAMRLEYLGQTPTLELHAESGGNTPGSLLANFDVPPVQSGGPTDTYTYTFSPTSSPILAAGSRYWFVLKGSGADFNSPLIWRSLASTSTVEPSGTGATTYGYATTGNSGSSWSYVTNPAAARPAIEVSGTPYSAVPEPTSFLLVAGLATACGLRRRLCRR